MCKIFTEADLEGGGEGLQNNNREVLFASMRGADNHLHASLSTEVCASAVSAWAGELLSRSLRSPSRGILPVLRLGTDDRGISEY